MYSWLKLSHINADKLFYTKKVTFMSILMFSRILLLSHKHTKMWKCIEVRVCVYVCACWALYYFNTVATAAVRSQDQSLTLLCRVQSLKCHSWDNTMWLNAVDNFTSLKQDPYSIGPEAKQLILVIQKWIIYSLLI